MRRPSRASGQPFKGPRHSTVAPKTRKAPFALVSIADLQKNSTFALANSKRRWDNIRRSLRTASNQQIARRT